MQDHSLLLDAKTFFEGQIPPQVPIPIRFSYHSMDFELSPADQLKLRGDNPLQSSRMQGTHVCNYLKEDKLRTVLKHWPKLLRALDEYELGCLKVECENDEVWYYPLEVLAVSPELLDHARTSLVPKEDSGAFPHGVEEYYAASFFYQARTYSRAHDSVLLALRNQPENVVFLLLLGSILSRMDQLKQACQVFKRIHVLAPRYAKNYLRLAQALQERKKYEMALISLFRGHEGGAFEVPWIGLKLFALGRNLVKLQFGTMGSLSTVQEHWGIEGPMDPNLFYRILDYLPPWNLIAFRQVCVAWNSLYERYVKVRWGESQEWQKRAKEQYGYKTLSLNGRTWRFHTIYFRYFLAQYYAEPCIVYGRFLDFLDRNGFKDPANRYPLVVAANTPQIEGFLSDVFTLGAALCERDLTSVLLTCLDPEEVEIWKPSGKFFYVNVPGSMIYIGKHKPFEGEGELNICERPKSIPFAYPIKSVFVAGVGWQHQADTLAVRGASKGISFSDLRPSRSNSKDPLKQPWNKASAYMSVQAQGKGQKVSTKTSTGGRY